MYDTGRALTGGVGNAGGRGSGISWRKRMDPKGLKELLEDIRAGRVEVDQAIEKLKLLPYEDMGFASVDHHRALRCGFPEVIFCEGRGRNIILCCFLIYFFYPPRL